MKYLYKKSIIDDIIAFLITIVIITFTILFNKFFVGIIAIFLIIVLHNVYYKMKDKKIIQNRICLKEKFKELKAKENATLFEKLYVNAYNDKAVEILYDVIQKYNLSGVYQLDFYVTHNEQYITFVFEHLKHKVYYHIYENEVSYYIDSPAKYDHLKINKEYEKVKTINVSVNNFETLAVYFEELIPSIVENISAINEFEENVEVIKIDKTTLEDINDFKEFYQWQSKIDIILSFLSIILFSILSYYCFMEMLETWNDNKWLNTFILICVMLMDAFLIFVFFYSIHLIFLCKELEEDMQEQNVVSLIGKPIKVRFIMVGVSNSYTRGYFYSGIELYFPGTKQKLIYAGYIRHLDKEKRNQIKEALLSKKLKLQYYKNSKVITDGAERIRRIVTKFKIW